MNMVPSLLLLLPLSMYTTGVSCDSPETQEVNAEDVEEEEEDDDDDETDDAEHDDVLLAGWT